MLSQTIFYQIRSIKESLTAKVKSDNSEHSDDNRIFPIISDYIRLYPAVIGYTVFILRNNGLRAVKSDYFLYLSEI